MSVETQEHSVCWKKDKIYNHKNINFVEGLMLRIWMFSISDEVQLLMGPPSSPGNFEIS
jgi:hypothetical protein